MEEVTNMKVVQKAKTTKASYGKNLTAGMSCLATCKKCPPMTC